ncbi:SMI1/KNR4 family protein [Streptomyces sp. rh34]|uniref:SMI1/KNR4 family protein n=1 Tax=Streptomyces sp. rh34 TaxID=2034272 RepID=UPI001180E591|nr:SMI1/KNR4 family protein [Streptomyces sp. rh34]
MHEVTWVGVRERVLRLAEHPQSEKVFGAQGHGFRLGPVMSEEQLRAVEADLGVGLPAQYRSFLLHVGAGGAGPHYGLMTPSLGDGGWQWRGIGLAFSAQPTTAEFAGRPFVAEVLQGELDALDDQEPVKDAFATDEESVMLTRRGTRATRSCTTRRKRARCSSASRDAAIRRCW